MKSKNEWIIELAMLLRASGESRFDPDAWASAVAFFNVAPEEIKAELGTKLDAWHWARNQAFEEAAEIVDKSPEVPAVRLSELIRDMKQG